MAPNLKFSIIIPVYNVEAYLSNALDSVVKQTYPNIEIICVNDGSTDRSTAILQEYAGYDNRIKVITQDNRGLFLARKAGIKEATGDYMICMDSDDWIDTDTCQILADFIVKNPTTDIIQYGVSLEEGDMNSKRVYEKWFNSQKISTITGNRNMLEYCYKMRQIPWNIATKVIKLSIAKEAYLAQPDVKFNSLEDFISNFYIMSLSNSWRRISNKFYHYRLGSGMATSNEGQTKDLDALEKTIGYFEAYNHLIDYSQIKYKDIEWINDLVTKDMFEYIFNEPLAFVRTKIAPQNWNSDYFAQKITQRLGTKLTLKGMSNCTFRMIELEQQHNNIIYQLEKYKKKNRIYKITIVFLIVLTGIFGILAYKS